MKKIFYYFILLSIFSWAHAYNLPEVSLSNKILINEYKRLENNFEKSFSGKINNLNTNNKVIFEKNTQTIKELFFELDNKVKEKNKIDAGKIIIEIKRKVKETIIFLKNITQNIERTVNEVNSEPLDNYAKNEKYWELMYYADYFEWKKTANWNIFSHLYFSAAKCNTPLNTMTQVWLWDKSLIIKTNDRPNCDRFPNLIDLSTTAFDYFFERYKWKQAWSYIELWLASKEYYKKFIESNIFEDEAIIIKEKTPNSYLLNESIHINWELSLPNREIVLKIKTPSGKIITLTKYIEKYFSFSYYLEEIWEYQIWFEWSENNQKIYVLDNKIFDWKKFLKTEINKADNIKVIKDSLWKELNSYRIVIKWNNYNMAEIKIWDKVIYYSWIWDILLPENVIKDYDFLDLIIKSSKTITGFSHDFYTEPVVIFDWNITIEK